MERTLHRVKENCLFITLPPERLKKNNLKAPQFFQVVYKVLLNKEAGPRLAPFILAVGRAKVAKLLKKI